MKNVFIKYSGTKIKYVDLINSYINKSKSNIYVEPFLGSGAVFFNLEKEFEHYVLNDINYDIINMYDAFTKINYSDVNDMKLLTQSKYDIKNNKEHYYEFRNYINTFRHKDDIYYGLGLYFLCNSCINSMARFGPNGFNQSFGNRYKVMTEKEFMTLSSRLKRSELNNKDFFDLDIPDNSLLFLDPPYIERPSSYKTIDNTFFNKLMEFIKQTDNDVLYTDIDHDFLNIDKITLRDQMRNTAPSSDKELTNKEIMFYKIK